jgi:hypothetical protein
MATRITLLSVKTEPTTFGYMADLNLPKNKGYDAVILCYNTGGGLKPISVKLPHQVYIDTLEKIYEKYGKDSYSFEITAIPICAKDYITVLNNKIDRIITTEK